MKPLYFFLIFLWALTTPLFSQVALSFENVNVSEGSTFTIPMLIQNPSSLAAADIVVKYKPEVLEFVSISKGQIAMNGILESRATTDGELLIGYVNSEGVLEDGSLLNIKFKVKGKEGILTQLTLEADCYDINIVDLLVDTHGGNVYISASTSWLLYLIGILSFLLLVSWLWSRKKKKKENEKLRQAKLKRLHEQNKVTQNDLEHQKIKISEDEKIPTLSQEEADLEKQLKQLREKKKLMVEEAELEKKLDEIKRKKNKE
ncbi:MAG: cohesin domain-containing protein [Saprospiraceae bacterium]